MKLKKELTTFYHSEDKAFLNFHELKCNLPGTIEKEFIHVRENLYPENVTSIHSFHDNGHIIFHMFFATDFGEYLVPVTICLHKGIITTEFDSSVYQETDNEDGYIEVELNEKQFNKVVKTCIPSIESFLENLSTIKRNHPCKDNCPFYNKKIKNGERDKLYVSKNDIVSKKGKK